MIQFIAYLFVILEMRSLTERGLAAVTFVRFFAGVDAPMVPERCVTGESFVTDLCLMKQSINKLHIGITTILTLLSRYLPHKRMAFRRCEFARGSSDGATGRIACRRCRTFKEKCTKYPRQYFHIIL